MPWSCECHCDLSNKVLEGESVFVTYFNNLRFCEVVWHSIGRTSALKTAETHDRDLVFSCKRNDLKTLLARDGFNDLWSNHIPCNNLKYRANGIVKLSQCFFDSWSNFPSLSKNYNIETKYSEYSVLTFNLGQVRIHLIILNVLVSIFML